MSAAARSWTKMTTDLALGAGHRAAPFSSSRRSPGPASNGDVFVSAMSGQIEECGEAAGGRSRDRLVVLGHDL